MFEIKENKLYGKEKTLMFFEMQVSNEPLFFPPSIL
jgi:hypothetical protein